jgi:hypothetical protein
MAGTSPAMTKQHQRAPDAAQRVALREAVQSRGRTKVFFVMPALVAGIHVYLFRGKRFKTWMAGTSPAMTKQHLVIPGRELRAN